MKFTQIVKRELFDWNRNELIGLSIVVLLLIYNHIFLHDSKIAIISSICGILYTILAGKGKIYCYFFGLLGSGCYIMLSFLNNLWGNALLYLLYYIPMQIIGIFRWSKNLKKDSAEIIKSKLSTQEKINFLIIAIIGCLITIAILFYFNDKSPIIDGITTFLSILGMHFTVKRLLEQWIVWIIVNGLSFIMWLILIINGAKAYSTLVMWGTYFVLAIYFYIVWKKELKQQN